MAKKLKSRKEIKEGDVWVSRVGGNKKYYVYVAKICSTTAWYSSKNLLEQSKRNILNSLLEYSPNSIPLRDLEKAFNGQPLFFSF
jgi:hypothetical protein